MTRAVTLALSATICMVLAYPAGADRPMDGEEIRDRIAGKRVYLAIPLGGEFPLHYKTNGTVDGSGEAVGLGNYMRPKDSGRWWIAGERLCQQWQSWYDGRQFCFTLTDAGQQRLRWTRDDGLSGRARIGE